MPPPATGMVDRTTGKKWYLRADAGSTDGAGNTRLALHDGVPGVFFVYSQVDGPWLGEDVRILVRNGRLGFEIAVGLNTNDPPTWAIPLAASQTVYQLYVPTSFNPARAAPRLAYKNVVFA